MKTLYRADQKTLDELKEKKYPVGNPVDGFVPHGYIDVPKARREILKYLQGPKTGGVPKNLMSKFYGNVGPILSTAPDDSCGGQRGNKKGPNNRHNWRYNPIYAIDIPNLKKYVVWDYIVKRNYNLLGFQPYSKFKSGTAPILYMNNESIKKATIFGIMKKFGVEVGFFTPIEFRFLSLHEAGEKFNY